MAWTTPRTWTTSEFVGAAMLNTNIRDDTTFLFQPPGASVTLPNGVDGIPISSGTQFSTVDVASTVLWDTDAMTSTNFTLTVNTAGVYGVCVHGEWDATAAGNVRRLAVMWNGAAHCAQTAQTGGAANQVEQNASAKIKAVIGDTFEVGCAQDSGQDAGISPVTNNGTHEMLSAFWCGAG